MSGIDFSGVPKRGLLGRLARFPLRLVRPSARMRIVQGPMRGLRWIAGSHTHGCWLGSYELDKQLFFVRHVKPGAVVFDIGANVGYYTLLSSMLAGPNGTVAAFEPVPRNLDYLKDHIKINNLANVRVFEAAVSDRAGTASFDMGVNSAMGGLDPAGPRSGRTLEVKLVCIDDLVESGQLPRPTHMKIDVEGAEADVLEGARRTITSGPRPTLFLATHGPAVHARCCEILRGMGYQLSSMNDRPVDQTDELLAQ